MYDQYSYYTNAKHTAKADAMARIHEQLSSVSTAGITARATAGVNASQCVYCCTPQKSDGCTSTVRQAAYRAGPIPKVEPNSCKKTKLKFSQQRQQGRLKEQYLVQFSVLPCRCDQRRRVNCSKPKRHSPSHDINMYLAASALHQEPNIQWQYSLFPSPVSLSTLGQPRV